MDEAKLKEFNEELKALLEKYNVALTIEDVPATKKIVVVSKEVKTQEENA